MPRVNIVDSGHAGPAAVYDWSWLPYTQARHLHTLREAFHIINTRITGHKACDAAYRTLAGGRSFAQVWADQSIWINYDPKNDGHNYGVTIFAGGKEVSITEYALRMGRWTTAATLIHELAHTNGADGVSHDAEGTLRHCLLRGLEDPTIMGMLPQLRSGTSVA